MGEGDGLVELFVGAAFLRQLNDRHQKSAIYSKKGAQD